MPPGRILQAGTSRARSGWRLPVLLLAVTLVIAATLLVAVGGGGSAGRARPPAQEGGTQAVSVQVDLHHGGAPVRGRYLGLSFEAAALAQLAKYGRSGNLAKLLRSLGPGLLRFGGVSADTRVAWVDAATPRPAWASSVLEAGDLRRLRKLAVRSGWRVLLTVGLAHYDARSAAREVAAAHRALGPWLAGVEVGNEPDAYAQHHLRPLPWTYANYNAEVSRYRRAIARLTPRVALAGPGVSGSLIFQTWGPGEADGQHPALLTGHHYPLGCRQVPGPTITALLSPHVRSLEAVSLRRYMLVSRRSSIAFRMDEANSVSCGGRAGISNAFASTLWATNYIAQVLAAGVAGINFQGNPANCLGYSPVCAPDSGRLASGDLQAQPIWYALLLTRELQGSRPLRTRLSPASGANVAVTALRGPEGALRLVIVADEPPGSPAAEVSVHLGRGFSSASVLPLTAPSPGATSGVLLGGRAVAADGSWHQPSALRRLGVHNGVLRVKLAPSSAALVTVAPAGSAPSR